MIEILEWKLYKDVLNFELEAEEKGEVLRNLMQSVKI
jgi:hypothetical protein